MYKILSITFLSVLISFSSSLYAKDVNISKNIPYVDVDYKNNIIRLERNQDTKHTLKGGFTKTSRNCPPFCIQPMNVASGVKTVGELEVVDFIAKDLKYKTGLLIDARTEGWHKKGTIPGSINIPFTVFGLDETDQQLLDAMKQLGVKRKSTSSDDDSFWSWTSDDKKNTNWDFSNAKDLVLWCNGMWCGQSPRAIKSLLEHGYPANKINYFRGGMQTWLILGLTVVKP
ncbi:MAG: rhodanese-like domain-containing protein [gamma proteobacterium symbiont of Bathyaustriella thionipta]|nr:rhodanese-like domain-containing protein [gamma proteobacterium symbiont of Bathyaustriella thionipta]MCU7949653.1 rhodanese-like domain-containing protein [gamma proteobacterium symbiont of Bathyaustriella thionipta]MCU7954389.1 rhodanese-like domain-containing protein [gamma proteobacterium symbiont of Bathyaustriella thionipta]MCU7956232.1 rhodanese-like domain-containing protein [gamma proteobacterium symbiont of Bathyaustriella thionipta]MCU7966299.1 rhodanese-like domain-containing pro